MFGLNGQGEPTPRRRCLLVEDQAATREWLRMLVQEVYPDVDVIEATNRREATQWLDRNMGRPDDLWLALIDLGLPDGSGISLIYRLTQDFPNTLSVVSSIYDDDTHLFEAISAGAKGYLLKDQDKARFLNYLQRIELGEPPLSPSVARRLLTYFHQKSRPSGGIASAVSLTSRETETLTLLARGLTINEIARNLDLKSQTVASYVKTIYQKLNISSRAEATLAAVQRGLA
ncbi:MAG: response regulator transcription factor [Asticcacaulis sp.]